MLLLLPPALISLYSITEKKNVALQDLFHFEMGIVPGEYPVPENGPLPYIIQNGDISNDKLYSIDVQFRKGKKTNKKRDEIRLQEDKQLRNEDFLISTIGRTTVIRMDDLYAKYPNYQFYASNHFIIARPNKLIDFSNAYLFHLLDMAIQEYCKQARDETKLFKISLKKLAAFRYAVITNKTDQEQIISLFAKYNQQLIHAQLELDNYKEAFRIVSQPQPH